MAADPWTGAWRQRWRECLSSRRIRLSRHRHRHRTADVPAAAGQDGVQCAAQQDTTLLNRIRRAPGQHSDVIGDRHLPRRPGTLLCAARTVLSCRPPCHSRRPLHCVPSVLSRPVAAYRFCRAVLPAASHCPAVRCHTVLSYRATCRVVRHTQSEIPLRARPPSPVALQEYRAAAFGPIRSLSRPLRFQCLSRGLSGTRSSTVASPPGP